jgi:hypothetical protein
MRREASSTNAFILRSILPLDVRLAMSMDWGDDTAFMGCVMVVLSLVYVHERMISEERLRYLLGRLGVDQHPQLSSIDTVLARMVKVGYLDKIQQQQQQQQQHIEYQWGPRAKVEMDIEDMIAFMTKASIHNRC